MSEESLEALLLSCPPRMPSFVSPEGRGQAEMVRVLTASLIQSGHDSPLLSEPSLRSGIWQRPESPSLRKERQAQALCLEGCSCPGRLLTFHQLLGGLGLEGFSPMLYTLVGVGLESQSGSPMSHPFHPRHGFQD